MRRQNPVVMAVGSNTAKAVDDCPATNQGKARRRIVDESFDAGKLIEFLASLIKDAGRKVFLILDNLRVHHRQRVKAWVAEPG